MSPAKTPTSRKPHELNLFHRNPRRGDVPAIEASLQAHSQYKPVTVNLGTHTGRPHEVLAGNHTVMAIRNLAEAEPDDPRWRAVATFYVDVDDDMANRIVATDNRTPALGGFDDAELAALLTSIADLGDLIGTGYTDEDLAAMQQQTIIDVGPQEGLTDPDCIPEMPETDDPVSKTGDAWVLGDHRVVCGDARDPAAYPTGATLVWTDPPYGVSVNVVENAAEGKARRRRKDGLTVQNDNLDVDGLSSLMSQAFAAALKSCVPGAVWYVAAPAGPLFMVFGEALNQIGVWRQTLMWVKDQFVLGRSHYHYRHEPIFYGWVPGAACVHAPAERTYDTVLEVARPQQSKEHPTMKPVELIRRCIEVSSAPGDLVLDPFGGSGTTLIAAHLMRRRAHLIEVDPKYVDVICTRFQRHTGVVPVLEATGVAHDFCAKESIL